MVAKRIAIIYLLMKGVDQSAIAEYLKQKIRSCVISGETTGGNLIDLNIGKI